LAGTSQIEAPEEAATVKSTLSYTAIIGIFLGAEIAVLGWVFLVDDDSKLHTACDNAVKQLLHSHDLAEITRARALIDEIPCAIRQRIRDDDTKEAP
jgi:hypothetical protein